MLVMGTAHAQALGRARRASLGQGMQCRTCCVGSVVWDVVLCGVPASSPSLTPNHTDNSIGDAGAAAVSKSLEINSVLTSLDLYCM